MAPVSAVTRGAPRSRLPVVSESRSAEGSESRCGSREAVGVHEHVIGIRYTEPGMCHRTTARRVRVRNEGTAHISGRVNKVNPRLGRNSRCHLCLIIGKGAPPDAA